MQWRRLTVGRLRPFAARLPGRPSPKQSGPGVLPSHKHRPRTAPPRGTQSPLPHRRQSQQTLLSSLRLPTSVPGPPTPSPSSTRRSVRHRPSNRLGPKNNSANDELMSEPTSGTRQQLARTGFSPRRAGPQGHLRSAGGGGRGAQMLFSLLTRHPGIVEKNGNKCLRRIKIVFEHTCVDVWINRKCE